jgi:DNA-binding HxlR family transcriptional regulator
VQNQNLPTELAAGGTNAVGRMLGLLGDEWTLLIVKQAAQGATRYGQFASRLPISNAVLTQRLQSMTDDDLLARRIYQANPPRSEYVLTPRGRSLWPVLTSIWEWERQWVPVHAEALPAMHHATCDSYFEPTLTCRECNGTVTNKDVAVQWGPSGSWSRSVRYEPARPSTRRRPASDPRRIRADLFPQTMSILGNRWAFALLVASVVGTTRFSDFQDQLGAPPGSLTDRLQIFVANGVLTPTDGGYLLTEKGRAVFPILITALQWAQRWFHAPEGPAVTLVHAGCGSDLNAILICDQCAEPLHGSTVSAI